MANITKNVLGMALVVFALLGVLFGMNIMSFIFGNLGSAAQTAIDQEGVSVTNETGAFINSSGYTVTTAGQTGFAEFTITQARNVTGEVIAVGNFTANSATGVITNATARNWVSVHLDYTYTRTSEAELVSINVNNDSLTGLRAYSNQSDTQFSTVGIAITLIILLSVFALFWSFFMGGRSKSFVGAGSA